MSNFLAVLLRLRLRHHALFVFAAQILRLALHELDVNLWTFGSIICRRRFLHQITSGLDNMAFIDLLVLRLVQLKDVAVGLQGVVVVQRALRAVALDFLNVEYRLVPHLISLF